ncbi:MAG: type IV pilus modification PilV family protein [Candidatus Binatia bacterium]
MRSRFSNLTSQQAFTLLEVVVAMAIVGLGVVTLLEIFSMGLRLQARGSERTEAMIFGQQAMDGFLVRRGMQGDRQEGSIGQKHRWSVQVSPFQKEDSFFSSSAWELQEITVEIRYRKGRREKPLEMKTLRLIKKVP